MKLTDRQWIGVAILAAIVGALLVWYFVIRDEPGPDGPDPITVVGETGGIKARFLRDPEVLALLSDKFKLTVEVNDEETIDSACRNPLEGLDYSWLGDQSQIPLYEECRGLEASFKNIFNTPLVIYSWKDTTDALIEAGVVTLDAGGVYQVDMLSLFALYDQDLTWSDLGLPDRPGKIIVEATDPNQSTSGQVFFGLLANTMNCLDVVDGSTVDAVLPGIHKYYEELGFVIGASAELFRQYMSQGEGAYPLVALLESQIVETTLANPSMVQQVQTDVRMLYPQPTAWLTHPLIAHTDGGERLMQALLDPEIQQLAWQKYGFRPTEAGVQIDLSIVPVSGVQENITSVIDIPGYAILEQIQNAATSDYVPDPGAPPRPDCDPSSTSDPSSPGAAPASPVAARLDSS